MEKVIQIERLLLRSRRLPLLVLALALLILGGAIALTTQQLRLKIREQIAGRDGEILHAVALMQLQENLTGKELLGAVDDLDNQLAVVLKASQIKGVMGVRLFDERGRFVEAFPAHLLQGPLVEADLGALRSLRPTSHFEPAARLAEHFLPETTGAAQAQMPLLQVNVPLHSGGEGPLIGIAQFLLEGHSIAGNFARLDQNLLRQSIAAFLAGGFLLTLGSTWALRRLRAAHSLLAERSNNLLRANQELALAAKTSAIGSVTSHLIHGLKNPLSGLQTFVAALASTGADAPKEDWEKALASTRRMQTLINQVVTVLREEESANQYDISLTELAEIISQRVQPLTVETGVRFTAQAHGEAVLPNRAANLVALILVNLVHNGLQASPSGKTVTLQLRRAEGQILCEVRDAGPGFPPALRPSLFQPCQSTKEGGSGIGLALSKQLANHLGAALDLKVSTETGCAFALTLPAGLGQAKTTCATVTFTG